MTMKTGKPCCRRGFTLVEMLVVIAIIGVLAALLVPTLYRVVVKARQNVIAQELNQLHLAIESYKQKFGDYPPDFTNVTAVGDLTTPNHLVVRHMRKAFPRHQEDLTLFWDSTNSKPRLDPSEALVFWLGCPESWPNAQLWEDPRKPLSGSGSRVSFFPFDEKRLTDPDGDGFPCYVPPQGKEMPYVYFDSRIYTDDDPIGSTTTPVASLSVFKDPTDATVAVLYPYATKVNETAPLTMANRTTYQLISAGLDGDYGDISAITAGDADTYKVFPFGLHFQIGDMDNIANFSDGKIFEDHME